MIEKDEFDASILDLLTILAKEIFRSNVDPNRQTFSGFLKLSDESDNTLISVNLASFGRCSDGTRPRWYSDNGIRKYGCPIDPE